MKLIPLIKKINGIKKDISENQTLISTILPLFRYLGWDIFDENQVIFEDVTSTKKRVDITFLFDRGDRFIIEAKRLTHKLSIKDFEQLTLYINSDESVNYGILTNGIDYWIADNQQDGLEHKKIYRFNIFELSECDLDILKIFFSYGARHHLENLNRYIEYIETGLEFGDKRCDKILQLGSGADTFESPISPAPRKKKVKQEATDKKLDFEEPTPPLPQLVEKEDSFELPEIESNYDDRSRDSFNDDEIIDLTDGEFSVEDSDSNDSSQEVVEEPEVEDKPEEKEVTQPKDDISADEVIEPEKDSDIEYFNLIEKSRAKIFLNGKYHIISDSSFSTVFLKILRYTFNNLSTYPVLFSKVVENFDFIVNSNGRTVQSAKYETIFNNYYYNININNYTKIVNLEELLKFIDENFE